MFALSMHYYASYMHADSSSLGVYTRVGGCMGAKKLAAPNPHSTPRGRLGSDLCPLGSLNVGLVNAHVSAGFLHNCSRQCIISIISNCSSALMSLSLQVLHILSYYHFQNDKLGALITVVLV